MGIRRGKTVAQQCRYYEVENIFEYMVSVATCSSNPEYIKKLYKELEPKARRQFVEYCFTEMNPEYKQEIILAII